jgi:hypothetical protein
MEVPPSGIASTAGGGDAFVGTIDGTLAAIDPATGLPPKPTPLDADRINPMEFTLAQQRYDAAVAEQQLAAARAKLVIIEAQGMPYCFECVNFAI